MNYVSTRSDIVPVSAAYAIVKGLCSDGGLFVPETFPKLFAEECVGKTYQEIAELVLSLYLTDFSKDDIKDSINAAYNDANFNGKLANTVKISNNLFAMELWHGPTCAFKDYALQLMPHLFVKAKKIINNTNITKILVATSGDTGKAALEGYKNLKRIKLAVFYPNDGTSEVQRLQMATQEGDNVAVYAINGNFDDAQKGVKSAFLDLELADTLKCKGEELSSANSINWGRLLPQIVYYYYSYCELVKSGEITNGEKIDYCVPTGNFGDILAGYYAKCMGLPVGKLICASNKNNVLYDFLSTGTYNAKRDFYKSTSPSMDILVSSNLERLLYHLSGDKSLVNDLMNCLAINGSYTVSKDLLNKLQENFSFDYASDEDVANEISYQFSANSYLCDTHTAVAFIAAKRIKSTGNKLCVVVSTASPFKFSGSVLDALGIEKPLNEFDMIKLLESTAHNVAPDNLIGLNNKSIRFKEIINVNEIKQKSFEL
ncbi:MAG: threonine synthase [Oscillospiraceae bacterium]